MVNKEIKEILAEGSLDEKKTITTPADLLIEYMRRKGKKVRTERAAKDLGLPLEQVEKWADVFEERGLLDIEYSPIKGMVLKPRKALQHMKLEPEVLEEGLRRLRAKPKIPSPKVVMQKQEQLVEKKEKIVTEHKETYKKLKKLSKKEEMGALKDQEKQLRQEIKDLKQEIEGIEGAPEEELKKERFFNLVRKTEKRTESVEVEVDEFMRRVKELERGMIKHKEKRR